MQQFKFGIFLTHKYSIVLSFQAANCEVPSRHTLKMINKNRIDQRAPYGPNIIIHNLRIEGMNHPKFNIRQQVRGLWSAYIASHKVRMYGCNLYLLSKSLIDSLEKVGVHVWFKQNLAIKHFFGNSLKAVKSQIWIAICVYLLASIAKKQLNLPASLQILLNLLKSICLTKPQ